jgi:5'-nucleotidase
MEQSSAMSHHITLGNNMVIREQEDFPVENVLAYALDGSPADCVRSAFLGDFLGKRKPDLVLSGVNKGANCGYDILYSATVGAAMEAVLYDVPAICFSQNFFPEPYVSHTDVLNRYLTEIIEDLIHRPLSHGRVWNVNFPSCPMEDFRGILTERKPAQTAMWDDRYVVIKKENGTREITLNSAPIESAEPGTDIQAVLDGYISIGIIENMITKKL